MQKKFTFELLYTPSVEECETSNAFFEFSLQYKEYEKYLLIRSLYNYVYRPYDGEYLNSYFLNNYIKYLTYYPLSCIFKNSYIKNIEDKINNLPEIKELINYKLENNTRILEFEYKELNQIESFRKIMKDFNKDIKNRIKNFLKKKEKKFLEKTDIMTNYHKFLNTIGIKNKKELILADVFLLKHTYLFQSVFSKYSSNSRENKIKVLNHCCGFDCSKVINNNSSFKNCLFSKDRYDILSFPWIIQKTIMDYTGDFVEGLTQKLPTTELTEKDFNHIPQLSYLKSLLSDAIAKKSKGINILLYGSPGTGKTALATVLISSLTKEGYSVPTTDKYTRNLNIFENDSSLDKNFRHQYYSILQKVLEKTNKSLLLFDEAEDMFRETFTKECFSKAVINDILENNPVPTIWTSNDLHCMQSSYFRRFTYILNIEELPQSVYKNIVNNLANKNKITLNTNIENMLSEYKPSIAIIEKAIKTFKSTGLTDQKYLEENIKDILQGQNFGYKLPKVKKNNFTFNPELINASVDLNDLTQRIKASGRLDFSLLLYGVPGSSKTSYARYLAEELGMKTLCKTYQDLASMWVGETEHNIQALFDEAEKNKAFIILDEADVLLRDRSTASKSWELSQVEAMLTCMEDHPYPFVMTTNLFESLDQAVMRRFLYKVQHNYLSPVQVNKAFKYFFNIDITENLGLSKITSGDFAVIKKQAEFQCKTNDKDWLIEQLKLEQNNKKDLSTGKIIF